MSAKISGRVWELRLDPMDKFVLLALADHADHEGNNVRPGNELLCAKTGLSEKTIGLKIEKLTQLGLIVPVAGGTGRGYKREVSVDPDAGERHEYFIERDRKRAEWKRDKVEAPSTLSASKRSSEVQPFQARKVELDAEKGRTSGPERSNLATGKVELGGNAYKEHEPSIEPSVEPSCGTGKNDAAAPFDSLSDSPGQNPDEDSLDLAKQAHTIWQEIFERALPIFHQELLAQVTDLEAWRVTLEDWAINRNSTKNFAGILRRYKRDAEFLQSQRCLGAAPSLSLVKSLKAPAPVVTEEDRQRKREQVRLAILQGEKRA